VRSSKASSDERSITLILMFCHSEAAGRRISRAVACVERLFAFAVLQLRVTDLIFIVIGYQSPPCLDFRLPWLYIMLATTQRAVSFSFPSCAGWSSPVAREAHNLEVLGSNPSPATYESPASSCASGLSPLERISIQCTGRQAVRPERSRVSGEVEGRIPIHSIENRSMHQ
jgi:hypothetical protein